MNDLELRHYGVKGMKWGVRRATYKMRSANSLRKSAKRIEKDNTKLENETHKLDAKSAKNSLKAAKAQRKSLRTRDGDRKEKLAYDSSDHAIKAAKLASKAAKARKLMSKNSNLLEKYKQRINELDPKTIESGKKLVEKAIDDYNTSHPDDYTWKNAETLKKAGIDSYWAPPGKIRLSQTTNKTPYYALSEKDRAAVDADYQSKRAEAKKRYDSASTEEKKEKAMREVYDLEAEYQIIVERDW